MNSSDERVRTAVPDVSVGDVIEWAGHEVAVLRVRPHDDFCTLFTLLTPVGEMDNHYGNDESVNRVMPHE